jgi:hypothetical protein
MTRELDTLLREPAFSAVAWRARDISAAGPVLKSGWPRLDAALPGGGWPLGTLIELLLPRHGVGELTLLLPALTALATADEELRWLTWIGPPHEPYAPALAQAGIRPERLLLVRVSGERERLWATEQALQSASCSAVLAWLESVPERALRRLKLAVGQGSVLGVLLRPLKERAETSPATLRLALMPTADGLTIEVVKRRGGGRERIAGVLSGA